MANPNVSFPELDPILPSDNVQENNRVMPQDIFASGTLPGNTVIRIGDENIKIDGTNRRITISDGTNDRILLGYQEGGF